MPGERLKSLASLSSLIFVFGTIQFVWLVWYFYTGYGGPQELVAQVLSLALILQVLFMHRNGPLYPRLPAWASGVLVTLYIAVCVYAFYYFHVNFEDIAIYRQGSYTQQDFVVGVAVFLLVMELSRLAHPTLFWVNVVLVVYTLWGYLSPIDFFWHPGTTFYRVVTRSRRLMPQTAVLGSSAIGMISGSGSANAAVVGTITIPLMIRYGVPPAFAAAVETSASMGGLIMPPMMGAAAFLMAEFLGVPYWDIVLRGFGFAFVYYFSVGVAIYLLSVRLMPRGALDKPQVPVYEKVATAVFFGAVAYLIYLLGIAGMGELRAALFTAGLMLGVLIAVFVYFKYLRKDSFLEGETLAGSIRRAIETHAEMTSYLTLLLATLGIMIGLFTVTGFINRMGAMLLDVGAWNIVAMILMAWVFGWLLGMGLPPTATYIIGAVIIVPPMTKLGVNPWVAHFFVFFLSVWGELSPPTSLTAAVAARIAEAPFMRTMWEALKICLPITLLTFAIFTRSEMAVKPGWAQIGDVIVVTIATCGVAFALFGRCIENWKGDALARILIR